MAGLLSDNAQFGTFAAFGSFALLVFLDPLLRPARGRSRTGWWSRTGRRRTLATACSMTVGTAVLGMAVAGFGVLMAASLGSYAVPGDDRGAHVRAAGVVPALVGAARGCGWSPSRRRSRPRPGCCCVRLPAPSRAADPGAESLWSARSARCWSPAHDRAVGRPPARGRHRGVVGHLRTGLDEADAAAAKHALLLLWSAQHLDSLRRVEPDLVEAAGTIAALRRRPTARLLQAVR